MVVLSAAIKAIPADILEAARVDGAVGRRLLFLVTLPMIRSTLIVVLTTVMITTLKIFDIVRTMTGGNFGTQVLANEMYSQSFEQYNLGRGSALAVISSWRYCHSSATTSSSCEGSVAPDECRSRQNARCPARWEGRDLG